MFVAGLARRTCRQEVPARCRQTPGRPVGAAEARSATCLSVETRGAFPSRSWYIPSQPPAAAQLSTLPPANHLPKQGRQPSATACYAAHINRHPVLPNSHQDHFSSCLLVGRTSDIRVTLRLSIGVQRLSYVCRMGATSMGVGTASVAYPKSAPGTRSVPSREQPPQSTLSPSKGFQRRLCRLSKQDRIANRYPPRKSRTWGVRSVFRKRKKGVQRGWFARWAGAEHQDRHDEGRAMRHIVLGGRHRGTPDFQRRSGRIGVVGDMLTGASLSLRHPHTGRAYWIRAYSPQCVERLSGKYGKSG